jgi:protein TonB
VAEAASAALERSDNQVFRGALPLAMLAWLGVVFVFARFVATPEVPNTEPPPIDARIVELPEPAPPKTEAPPPPRPRPPPPPKPAERPLPRKVPEAPPPTPALEEPPKNLVPPPAPEPQPAPAPEPPPPPPPPPKATTAFGNGHTAARAIYQPVPKIPADLQSEAMAAVAVARFQIATDGTVTVELVKPTPNPQVNRMIVDTLKTWKFFPEMLDGKPVPSTQELKIKIDIS